MTNGPNPPQPESKEERYVRIASALADCASWLHFLILVDSGGKALVALLTAQGLALGFRSVAFWMQQR